MADAPRFAPIIDGREVVKGHGGAGMPVWRDAFKASHQGYDEKRVKAVTAELVQYLVTLQGATPPVGRAIWPKVRVC